MKAFHKPLLFLLALMLGLNAPVIAQQNQNDDDREKIIIITKTTDDDGNEVVKRIEKTHSELNGDQDVNIEIISGDRDDMIIINMDDEEGIDIGEDLENINININENDGEKTIRIRGIDKNGEEVDIEWRGDGEIPENVRAYMGNRDHHAPHRMHRQMRMNRGSCGEDTGFLGVVLGKKVENINGEETTSGESDLGVLINEIVEGSAAEAAGMQAGDIISSIDGNDIQNFGDLTEAIQNHKPGETIAINYIRDGQNTQVEATLKSKNRGSGNAFYWMDDEANNFEFDFDDINDFDFDDMGDFEFKGFNDFHRKPCKPFIGVYLNLGTDTEGGIAVQRVIPNTPADEVDLQAGDLITAIDGKAVSSHSALLLERDKHEAGDNFTMTYLRDGQNYTVDATFPACDPDDMAPHHNQRVIIIKKKKESIEEAPETVENINVSPSELNPMEVPESNLALENFRAFPNPSEGLVTLRFEAEAAPIIVTVTDISGKEIFRESLNNFDGNYNRQLDLTEANDGTLLLSIRQKDQVFTDRIIMKNSNRP